MNINPIYRNELKMNVRSNRLYQMLFLYNGLLALFTLAIVLIVLRTDISGGVVKYGIILKIYGIITAIEYGLLLLILPSIAASTISGEKEKQTLDLLLTTKISNVQIIIGKLLSTISVIALLATSSLPILGLVFIIGGISFLQIIQFLLIVISTGFYIGSIGILCSTIFKRTIVATVVTYCIEILLIIGSVLFVWMLSILRNYSEVVEVFTYLLTINPAFTFLSMIRNQIGFSGSILELIDNIGTMSITFSDDWLKLSISVQLLLSIIFIIISSLQLNPSKKK